MAYRPDFSSSSDEFDDDDGDYYNFKQKLKNMRINDDNSNPKSSQELTREYQIKDFYYNLSSGNTEKVIQALDDGVDINKVVADDWYPVQIAASIGRCELLEELLNRGADINCAKDGLTLLMLAANCPDATTPFDETARTIQLLLNKGVEPNAINRKRMTAIMFAAGCGNIDALKLLVPVSDLETEDNQKWTVLFWAVYSGRVDAVQFLLESGSNVEHTDLRSNTILDVAKDNDYEEIVQLLSHDENDEVLSALGSLKVDFEQLFKELKPGERPQFFLDVCSILFGTRTENLMKLFYEKEVKLHELLSCSETDLIELGVFLPYQRNRLLGGVFKFHKQPFHSKSLKVVGKNEIYSNLDVATEVMSAIKHITAMESSLNFILKNCDVESISNNEEINESVKMIRRKIASIKYVQKKLIKKVKSWDRQVQPVNIIDKYTKKRSFPWRRVLLIIGVTTKIIFKLSK